MKTAHATVHGSLVFPDKGIHAQSASHHALALAESTVGAVVLVACEVVILWILLSSIYFSALSVH